MNKAETQIGLVPGFQLGGYRVEAACGEGGFAVVYRAVHEKLKRPAAIKVLHARLASRRDLVERFTREAQMITRIHHPNVVDIYDFGTMEDGRPYFVMEWVDGKPLSTELRRRQRFSPTETLALAKEIAAGLSVIHRAGVIHRDLKSNNIMLLADSDLRIKLLDFGIAKVLDQASELSLPGMQLGTPETMSPEQIRCGEVSPASDIYSFGILLFELLTGRLPFRSDNDRDIHKMQLQAARPKPSDFVEVTSQVDQVIATCMAINPADRYPSVEDVVRNLEEAIAVHSTPTDPVTPGSILADSYRITRLLGRGGMGVVYEGEHTRLPHRLAIKVISGTIDRESLVRFRREAEIASGLGHSNIVRVLDFNTLPSGTPYMVMEYLDGRDLRSVLKEGPVPLSRAMSIARQTGSALAAAHAGGIVHRDLKPSNIFLTMREVGGEIFEHVTVLDFGVSKIQDSSTMSTDTRALVGTPQYMAPEQAMGDHRKIDGRSDQFALACLIYEMLTGTPAFSGEKLAEIVYKVCYSEPPAIETLVTDLDPNIAAAISRGMTKEIGERFPDVPAFIEALTGRPLEALPRTRMRRPSGASSVDRLPPVTPRASVAPAANATLAATPSSREKLKTPGSAGALLADAWGKREIIGTAPTMASPEPPIGWEDEPGPTAPGSGLAQATRSGATVPGPLRDSANRATATPPAADATIHDRGTGSKGTWIAIGAVLAVVAVAAVIVVRAGSAGEQRTTGPVVENQLPQEPTGDLPEKDEITPATTGNVVAVSADGGAAVDGGSSIEDTERDTSDSNNATKQKSKSKKSPPQPEHRKHDEKSRSGSQLPAEAAEALKQASASLAAGDYSGALRQVRRSMQIKVSGQGFALMVQAYCGKGNVGAARDYLARVPKGMRSRVIRNCKSKFEIDLAH